MINYCDLILTYNLMLLCTYLVSLQAFQVYQRDLTPNKEREREKKVLLSQPNNIYKCL